MEQKNPTPKTLKVFFIKLIAITIAIIISINVLFNLLISDKMKYLEPLFALTELENRKLHGDKIRGDINKLLKKNEIIKKEDRALLYKLYKKIESEFKDIEK